MASGEDRATTTINHIVDRTLYDDSSQEGTEEQTLEALQEQLLEKERKIQRLTDQLSRSHQVHIKGLSQPVQRVQNDIVILIDSNGRFISETKLFPRDKVVKFDCPNTQKAIELLSEEHLGTPTHIIIHTGSSQLRREQDRLSESLKGVIEKASNTFPNSRVVMSALLPMKYMHTDTINKINIKLEKECEKLPNVHFAKHSELDVTSLYDDIHLSKHKVHIFAQKLKDLALDRYPSTHQRNVQGRSSSINNFYFNFK
ncbi:uncharacterized protein LOC120436091 [Oreochromis aureus]|uniref:uncharacterized protein LOC120436091 n=1 Tax=Oreochromis aureus TaxID=47969 RepID=UPI001952AF33|nr:uncharacterized protein LOC120436091 [Oreochromis aureus]